MEKKKELSAEEIYKRNQKRSKVLRRIAPFVFWGLMALSLMCFIISVRNSYGNIVEILHMLDDKAYTGEQLSANYNYLINKYGEWIIGSGGSGFTITFINIGRALFSGLMITCNILSGVFFVLAYVLGKWLLPKISAQLLIDNQDMVNLEILKGKE